MGERSNRTMGKRALHAACGAFLAGLSALPALFWWFEIHWGIVCICAAMGLVMGWFFGDEAIAFLIRLAWWW
jgi:hypothetical protein